MTFGTGIMAFSVTGPTGSGKTKSMLHCMRFSFDNTRNILTAEDPIEYQLEGIGQTQVNKGGYDLCRALKSHAASRSRCVMVGRSVTLRRLKLQVQASPTGHLVRRTAYQYRHW